VLLLVCGNRGQSALEYLAIVVAMIFIVFLGFQAFGQSFQKAAALAICQQFADAAGGSC
jgi:hypothetical protein